MKPKLEDGFINVKEDLLLYIFLFIMGLPVPYLNFVISIKMITSMSNLHIYGSVGNHVLHNFCDDNLFCWNSRARTYNLTINSRLH